MITYRWLEPQEVESLRAIFDVNGGELPDPKLSAIYGALNDEGKVVGFHVVQLVPHAEPMYVEPEYRAKVNWREFQRGVESVMQGVEYYIFPSDDRVAKLCKRGGMEEVPMRAFRKVAGKN